MIWRLAIPQGRIIPLEEVIEFSDTDDEEEDDPHWPARDKNVRSIDALNHQLRYCGTLFSNYGQFQLEDCGFTSSRMRPELATDEGIRLEEAHEWDNIRVSRFRSMGPLPVLFHVCPESRNLLWASGYVRAFSTRTSPARELFKSSSECLYLKLEDIATGTVDDKAGRIAQFARQDLERVRKLALNICGASYLYGGEFPPDLHTVVQRFGNLEELLLVESDQWFWFQDSGRYNGNPDRDIIAADVAVELWGHFLGWERDPESCWGFCPRWFYRDYERGNSNALEDAAKGVQKQFRDHPYVLRDSLRPWTAPEVRFVMLMERCELKRLLRSRLRYRQYMEGMNRLRPYDLANGHRPILPFGEDIDAEQLYSSSNIFAIRPPKVGFYCQATNAIRYGNNQIPLSDPEWEEDIRRLHIRWTLGVGSTVDQRDRTKIS